MWHLSWMVSLSMVAKITGHRRLRTSWKVVINWNGRCQYAGSEGGCGWFWRDTRHASYVTWNTETLSWAFTAKCSDLTARFPVMFGRWMIRFVVCSGSTATLSKAQNKGKLVVSITATMTAVIQRTSFITLNNWHKSFSWVAPESGAIFW